MSKSLRENIAQLVFKNKLKKIERKKQYLSFDAIKQVGILIDLYDENNFEIVKEYVKEFSSLSKEVIVLGFYPGKELPNKYLLLQRFKFFTQKDINFWGIPNKPVVTYFISKSHDLLIDCTTKKNFYTKYILGLSLAKLKAGYYKDEEDLLDFMIKDGNKKDLRYLFDQTLFYLKQLKNK